MTIFKRWRAWRTRREADRCERSHQLRDSIAKVGYPYWSRKHHDWCCDACDLPSYKWREKSCAVARHTNLE